MNMDEAGIQRYFQQQQRLFSTLSHYQVLNTLHYKEYVEIGIERHIIREEVGLFRFSKSTKGNHVITDWV